MRKLILIAVLAAAWLLADPSLEFSARDWFEVGVTPAVAAQKHVNKRFHGPVRHRTARRSIRGSSTPVLSNQPGLYPMQTYAPPTMPDMPTVMQAPDVPGFPQIPTVAVLPRGSTGGAGAETYSDKAVRCSHQAGLSGLSVGQQNAYVGTCVGQ